jgi:hypothetical protein
MDRAFSDETIRLYMREMDRVVDQIRLEQLLACNRQHSRVMLRLANLLIQFGNQLKQKFQPTESGCAIPYMIYRQK